MYTKLVIIVNGKEVLFCAHEIIQIAIDLTNIRIHNNADEYIQRQLSQASLYNNPLEKFNHFSEVILSLYEKKYEISNSGILKNFLDEIYNQCETGNVYWSVVTVPSKWGRVLEHIRGKRELEPTAEAKNLLKSAHKLKFMPIPEPIQKINTIDKWLSLSKQLSMMEQMDGLGWWFLLNDRLIHVNFDPNNRENSKEGGQHFYVSDHGPLNDVYRQIEQVTYSHSLTNDFLYPARFFKRHETCTLEERNLIKKNFIYQLHNVNINDDSQLENLLYSELLVPYRLPADKPVEPLREYLPINRNSFQEYNDIFEATLEKIKYKALVRVMPYFEQLFQNGKTIFNTQVANIMTQSDADIYIECKFLAQLMCEVNKGERNLIFRSTASYGKRDKGDSYHDFEKAFLNYFKLPEYYSESELASITRKILKGENSNIENCSFIPNLVGAWFIAEAARNKLSILTGLMLLDMIESGIQLLDQDGNNWYSWRNALIHPLKGGDQEKEAEDLYGRNIKNIDRFGGSHPMAHGGSFNDATEEKFQNSNTLTPVRQKEGSLILHWLQEKLAAKGILSYLLDSSHEPLENQVPNFDDLLSGKEHCKHYSKLYKKIEKLHGDIRRAKENPKSKVNITKTEEKIKGIQSRLDELIEKEIVQKEIIIPELLCRLSSLDNLLNLDQNLKKKSYASRIGPREIDGFNIVDVDDDGNCFYRAVADQMRVAGHQIIDNIAEGTELHDILRLRIQGQHFRDREWADDRIFDSFVTTFPDIILAIIDTRHPASGFVYYYLNENGNIITNTGDFPLPEGRIVIRIAATGNHFMSVRSHPSLLYNIPDGDLEANAAILDLPSNEFSAVESVCKQSTIITSPTFANVTDKHDESITNDNIVIGATTNSAFMSLED